VPPGNYMVHLCCHTGLDDTIPELSTEGKNYTKTYRTNNCNTTVNIDDDLTDIT
jgi:hypothetical protein